jgi:hypothetical protein
VQLNYAGKNGRTSLTVFISLAIKYDSPDCRQEVITANMAATKQENAFCVMDYAQ